MHDEIWLPVPGYEGAYSVSNLGRVRSEARTVPHPSCGEIRLRERVLKQATVTDGYLSVDLSAGGVVVQRRVHALVLEAFVGACPRGHEACHNDSDPQNNRLDNLRWDTRSGNFTDKLANGTHNRGARNNIAKLTDVAVLAIRSDPRDAASIAADFGITPHHVRAIKRGAAWAWM